MLAWSFHPAAIAEVEAAATWLDQKDPVVAVRFLKDLEESIEAIRAAPGAFPRWPGIAPRFLVRRCVMRRFSFSIAFLVERERLVVLAVAHQRRRPRYWARRLRAKS